MTFGGKKYETSSRLKRTPPIGAPKATATPAALAALNISRRLPDQPDERQHPRNINVRVLTFIVLILDEISTDDVAYTASDVNKGALFAKRETARRGTLLRICVMKIGNLRTMRRSEPAQLPS